VSQLRSIGQKTKSVYAVKHLSVGDLHIDLLRRAGITSASPFLERDKFDEIYAIMKKIYTASSSIDMGDELIRTAGLYEILGTVSKGLYLQEKNSHMEYAARFFEEHYADTICVSDIARRLGFSRSHFSTLFTQSIGIAPYAYLNSVRIRHACDLLLSTDLSVTDISERVGIASNNFSRIFKSETGMTPTAFKKKTRI